MLRLTQAMPDEATSPTTSEKFGYLVADDQWYEIGIGETKIGRDPSLCSIVLENESLSNLHAVIESEGAEDTFIYDAGSTNKSRMGKMTLKPHCRYKINNNDVIILGCVNIKFKVLDFRVEPNRLKSQLIRNADSLGVGINLNHSFDSSLTDDGKPGKEKHLTKDVQGVFKTPLAPVLSQHRKLSKKHYYELALDEGTSGIPNQVTQCNVSLSGEKGKCNEKIDLNCTDDIYDLPTQCEYVSDMSMVIGSKPKIGSEEHGLVSEASAVGKNSEPIGHDKSSHEGQMESLDKCEDDYLEDNIPTQVFNENEVKSSEKMNNHNLNYCRTSGFFVNRKVGNSVKSHFSESFDDDIFNLVTQCGDQDTINESPQVSSRGNLNVINKLNGKSCDSPKSECAVPDSSKTCYPTLNVSTDKTLSKQKTGVCADSKNVMMFLNDSEDEELCEFMRVNSPTINMISEDGVKSPKREIKTEVVIGKSQTDVPDEIFDMATQVSFVMEKSRVIPTTSSSDKECSTSSGIGNEEEKLNSKSERFIKEQENVGGDLKDDDALENEDLILTQKFVAVDRPKAREEACVQSKADAVTVDKRQSREEHKTRRDGGSGDSEELEDLKPTQIFDKSKLGEQSKGKGSPEGYQFQDDIPTQIFAPNFGPLKEDNGTRIGVNATVELNDSGDETESDLDIKLDYVSSVVRKPTGTSEVHEPSTSRMPSTSAPRRCSSSSSDRTLSDLDVVQLDDKGDGVNDEEEDYILTQIFPHGSAAKHFPSGLVSRIGSVAAGGEKSKGKVENYEITVISSDDEVLQIEENSNESESLIKDIEEFTSSEGLRFDTLIKDDEGTSKVLQGSRTNEVVLKDTIVAESPALGDEVLHVDVTGVPANTNSDVRNNEIENCGTGLVSDSDETDCEEELKALTSGIAHRMGTFTVTKKVEIAEKREGGISRGLSPGDSSSSSPICKPGTLSPTLSNVVTGRKTKKAKEQSGEGKRGGSVARSGRKCEPKSKNTLTQFLRVKSNETSKANTSPLKRTRQNNAADPVPKKRTKSSEDKRKNNSKCNLVSGDGGVVVLTQSLELRNRVVKKKKDFEMIWSKKSVNSESRSKGVASKPLPSEGDDVIGELSGRCTRLSSVRREEKGRLGDEEQWKRTSVGGNRTVERRKDQESEESGESYSKIIFTGFESESHNGIIARLGGEKVRDLAVARVLITDRVRRTVKFLSAVALGIPIVSPNWLVSSEKEKQFLNPWDFLLEDKSAEDCWKFNLKTSLEKWRKQKLLIGYTVYATENTKPPVPEILSIVECCGGIPVTVHPTAWPEKSLLLSCIEDRGMWPPAKHRQVKIVHYEFLLSGVLRHCLDFKTYKLR